MGTTQDTTAPRTAKNFLVGTRVTHGQYGAGTIVNDDGADGFAIFNRVEFDSGATGTSRTRVRPITHESQEDTMASTKTDAPKPPARRRRTAAADAPAVTDAALSKGLQEYRNRREAAAANRTKSEAEAVAERATQVKAEQDAAPAKPKRGPSAEQIAAREAKKTADAERVAKVIEMRKAGKKLSEIAAELGYTSQQVVSGVLRRHAPELQTQREAGTGGLTLTAEQVTELQAVEAKFGAKLTTLARALARATA